MHYTCKLQLHAHVAYKSLFVHLDSCMCIFSCDGDLHLQCTSEHFFHVKNKQCKVLGTFLLIHVFLCMYIYM